MASSDDTIFALATSPGRAGIAVVRLSGRRSNEVLGELGGTAPSPRSSRVCRLRDRGGDLLDEALILGFAEGASFTGEAVVELHLHGSIAVVRAVLSAIEATGLARLAEPGEFTRRALLNGRLDLSQVQGLGDLIDAETEAQRRHAMRFLSGEMAERVGLWRKNLVRATALLEATIDFADEDVPEDVIPEVQDLLRKTALSIRKEIEGAAAAKSLRQGFEVAIVGAPNVGKSSFLNRLTRSDAAIVSHVAGTTRDVIEVRMDVLGMPVTFLDTAGIRETDDIVEALGIERARARASASDLRILLYDGTVPEDRPLQIGGDDLLVRTKRDLVDDGSGVSSLTGEGVSEVLATIGEILSQRVIGAGLIASDRDRAALDYAAISLDELIRGGYRDEPEVSSAKIRTISAGLQSIIGGVGTEAILSEIFSSFCLGK